MEFTINFQANTTGVHHIGYRTYDDPINTYNIIDVTVTTPGLQSVTISVPGNLYCAYAGIIYTGYVIAACQDQTISGGDGIPDFSVTWTVTIDQVIDTWRYTWIECQGTSIDTITIVNDGTALCSPDGDYPFTFTEVTPGDEITPAVGYATVTGGKVVSYTITDYGKYKAAPTVTAAILNCDTEPEFTATLDGSCGTIMLSDYACHGNNDVSANSEYTFGIGDSILICADPTTLGGLMEGFEVIDMNAYHCEICEKVILTTASTLGSGKVTYQTCWDEINPYGSGIMVSKTVPYGSTLDLGCVVAGTVKFDDGTLNSPIIMTDNIPCIVT